ncbi:hypothetical protein [Sulfurimonas sp.]|uniref:hypothetical protein n=1 Tax=Sulfurimonas sp. TaxID=2022749 RepID=UPI003567F62D
MNIETVENEIYDFIDEYFDEELFLVESQLDFIEDNHLITPKINYTHIYPFLSLLLSRFEVMDHDFASSIIKKTSYDVKHIEKTYGNFLEKTQHFENVFKNFFIPSSTVLSDYANEILDLQKGADKSSDDFKQIKHMKQNLIDLKKIYFEVFEKIFSQSYKNINNDFKMIINTKIFYLDRLIWRRATKSENIIKHLQVRKLDEALNAESYLNLIMSMMRPYTDEYKYLEQCLKVYKR